MSSCLQMYSSAVNWIVALSNFVGVFVLLQTVGEDLDPWMFGIFVLPQAFASFAFHLAEHINHDLEGVGVIRRYERVLLSLDRGAAILAMGLSAYRLFWDAAPALLVPSAVGMQLLAVALFFVSETAEYYVKRFVDTAPWIANKVNWRWYYALTHSGWHVCAFYVLGQALKGYSPFAAKGGGELDDYADLL